MSEAPGKFFALPTPLTDDGSQVSEVRVARLARLWMKLGATGFALNGEAGEFTTITSSERKSMLEIVNRECQNSVPIIVNVSSLSTAMSLDIAQHAARHGARAVWLMPPYYGIHTQAEMVSHIRTVASYSNLAVVVVDPTGLLSGESRTGLMSLPQLQFADGRSCDEWSTAAYICTASEPMAQLLGSDRTTVESAFRRLGSAPVIKAAHALHGLELGSPRSPKAEIHPQDLVTNLGLAA